MPLLLCFSASGEAFGLDVREVLRVLPRVRCSALPGAPEYVTGLMDLEGAFVPVIDLCRLMGAGPCRELFSSRIVLVRFPRDEKNFVLLGLLVENATEVIRVEEGKLIPPPVSSRTAPFLSAVGNLADRPLQKVNVSALLPPDVADLLFAGVSAKAKEEKIAAAEDAL